MRQFKILGKTLFEWGEKPSPTNFAIPQRVEPKANVPVGRVSQPDLETTYDAGSSELIRVNPLFLEQIQYIPIIRKLCYSNEDMSQALSNIVELGNTGHEITFDKGVSEDEAFKMKAYLNSRKLEWSETTSGMDGMVNKMMAQIIIGGALSVEWVPKNDLSGIDRVVLVNPETIQFVLNPKNLRYEPYQRPRHLRIDTIYDPIDLIKLNLNTYKYYALNGDTEIPYGIPIYLPALKPIERQNNMIQNIDFIVEKIGLMGFLSALVAKPDMEGNESEANYKARCESILTELNSRLKGGLKNGILSGFMDETEIKFESPLTDSEGASKLWELNELQLASALKQDSSLLGRPYGTTETQITVIFTKLLSQLKNIQMLVKKNLEFGYALDLRLAGFSFKSLEVKFNPSTVLDELKYQQALEVKIRNFSDMYYDGIISLDAYAQAMGYEAADQKEVRFLRNKVTPVGEAKQQREQQKDASDKKVRKKNKPQEKKIS